MTPTRPSSRLWCASTLLLGACAVGGGETAAPPAVVDDDTSAAEWTPSEWSYTPGTHDTIPLDAETFSAALSESLSAIPRFDPLDLMITYADRLRLATGECPDFEPASAQTYWEGDCVSGHDAHFDGWGVSHWGHGVADPQGGTCVDEAFLYAFGRITDEVGVELTTFGTATYQDCVRTDGVHHWETELIGDFAFPGAPDTWLATRQPVELTVSAEDAAGVHRLVVDGGLSDLPGPLASVWLDALEFDAAGTGCAAEPAGVVLAWDDGGAAYVVRFEGGSACDGCGEVEGLVDAGGAPLEDTLCVDWSAYNDWEDRPWWP